MKLPKTLLLAVLATLLTSTVASAQYFGRNKVQYEDFDFRTLRTPHFDVNALVDAFGNAPWPLMQSAFYLLRPTLAVSKLVGLVPGPLLVLEEFDEPTDLRPDDDR